MDNTTAGINSSVNHYDCAKPTWGYDVTAVQVLGFCLAFTPLISAPVNVIALVFIIRAPKLKANTRVCLGSVMMCNTLFGVIVLPLNIFGMIFAKSNSFIGKNDKLCEVGNGFEVMLRISALMHMSFLAYDRFLTMCRPFRRAFWLNRSFDTFVFIGCWMFPAILSFSVFLPRLQLIGIIKQHDCLLEQTKMCNFIANKSFSLTHTCLGFAVPSVFILLCNNRTMASVRRRETVIFNLLQINTKRGSFNRRHFGTKLARTICAMTSCFLCCWLPFFVVNFADPLTSYRVPRYIWLLVTWFGYASTVTSPVIYMKSTGLLSFGI